MTADAILGWAVVIASLVVLARYELRHLWRRFQRWCATQIERHVDAALLGPDLPPLPPPDADDAAFEAWALQALGLGNSAAFDTTRRQIADLPETGTA